MIREVTNFAGFVNAVLRHYALGDQWTDAIECFERFFDEICVGEGLGEEERLGVLALEIAHGGVVITILIYGEAIARRCI